MDGFFSAESKRPEMLDWRQRPESVNKAINAAFNNIAKSSEGKWLYNGYIGVLSPKVINT